MKGSLKFGAAVWVVSIVVGVLVELAANGYGALAGGVTAVSLSVVLLHRWKDALYASSHRAYLKTYEAEAMGLLAPKDDYPYLPWSVWALAPDAMLRFVGFLRVRNWRTVVECGSGISTVLLAREFRARGAGHVYALEHDAEWADLVRDMLAERGLSDWGTVLTAPLAPMECDGMKFQWYSRMDIAPALALEKVDALLVDGPKGDTNPLARYPALPTFAKQLGSSYMVVLDDGHREDESRIAALWSEKYGAKFELKDTVRGQWECIR